MTAVVDGVTIRTRLDVDAAAGPPVGGFGAAAGVHVATVPTPITPAQALGALLAAGCPQGALLMVAAQSAVETNAWGSGKSRPGRGFNNWNAGNVTPSGGQLAAGITWMDQGISGMKYIARTDAVSGGKDMLGWLQSHGLLGYAAAGDLTSYMGQLRSGCYLGCIGQTDPTGWTVSQTDYDNYQAGISSWMRTLAGVQPVAPPGGSLPSSAVRNVVLVVGILGLGAAAAYVARQAMLRRYLRAA